MTPEKLAIENEENNNNDSQKKKDSKCEIYSVGALLWEIAELKKPHYDLDKSVLFVGIRKRVSERYCLPFSNDVPTEWRTIVTFNIYHLITIYRGDSEKLPEEFIKLQINSNGIMSML
ncbi:unnamed protein product [Rhizophagus irregularis]|nr:unnamed protein product [Rhizophagus irregularis]